MTFEDIVLVMIRINLALFFWQEIFRGKTVCEEKRDRWMPASRKFIIQTVGRAEFKFPWVESLLLKQTRLSIRRRVPYVKRMTSATE